MDGLTASWWVIAAILYFALPGLPIIALLRRRKLISIADGLVLVPVISISVSITTMVISYFTLGLNFGAISWAIITLTIAVVCTVLYAFSLLKRKESIKNHILWIVSEIKSRIKPFILKRNTMILLGIIGLALLFSYFPRIDYVHPLHSDEWHYWGYAENMVDRGTWTFTVPYYGWDMSGHAESGFLLFIGTFQNLSALDWNTVFIVLPLLITLVAVLLAYRIGKAIEAGLTSALFVAMLPTGLRFLGMGFLVPLSLGLCIILALLLLVLKLNSLFPIPVILLTLAFLLLVHPPSALVAIVVLFSGGIIFLAYKRWWEGASLVLICISIVGLAISLPSLWTGSLWAAGGFEILDLGNFFLPEATMNMYIETFGFWLFILGFIGGLLLAKERKSAGFAVLTAVGFVGGLALGLRYVFNRITDIQALHDRTVFLFFGLSAFPSGKSASWLWGTSKTVAVAAISISIVASAYIHVSTPYYHIVTEDEYQDFVWIRDNLGANYTKALLDPWKAVAFGPVTRKLVYYKIPQGPDSNLEARIAAIQTFFGGNCTDTAFLLANGINIVYTQTQVDNPLLTEVHPHVYVLESQNVHRA
ncbi:MAG: hypothetical protein HZB92_09290 [Euryarchaeota archaeon]|nr:hypothetical protein [Euryarchaeota archaeon]